MNDSRRIMRRPQRARPPNGRTAAAIIATAALAMLAAACSSPSPTGSGGSPSAQGFPNSPSAVAYSSCIRSHGVPNFPDPTSNGQVPKADAQELRVSNSRLQAAQTACQHLYPANDGAISASLQQCEEAGDCPPAMVQQVLTGMRRFAQCMRTHGVPNWPDPTVDSEGRPGFNLLHTSGFDPNSLRTDQKMNNCEFEMPGGAPVPLIRPGRPG